MDEQARIQRLHIAVRTGSHRDDMYVYVRTADLRAALAALEQQAPAVVAAAREWANARQEQHAAHVQPWPNAIVLEHVQRGYDANAAEAKAATILLERIAALSVQPPAASVAHGEEPHRG